MESHDQINQGERQGAQDQQNQEGRQESIPMITELPQDQNQDGKQAQQQQQNMVDTETQPRHEEAARRIILQQATGRARSGHDSHALRVYRGNWRGAQMRSVLKKRVEDLKMQDAIDRFNESPNVNVRMVQQRPYKTILPKYPPITPLVRAPMIDKILTPAPHAFMPAYASSYPFFNPMETMEGNNSSTTHVLRTRDFLSNFGVNNSNVRDDVQPPVEANNINTLRGFNIEHGESSAGPRAELKEIDFLGVLGNRADGNNGVVLNLSL